MPPHQLEVRRGHRDRDRWAVAETQEHTDWQRNDEPCCMIVVAQSVYLVTLSAAALCSAVKTEDPASPRELSASAFCATPVIIIRALVLRMLQSLTLKPTVSGFGRARLPRYDQLH